MAIESTLRTPSGLQIYLSHPWYLIKSGYLILTWIMLGFHLELIGPTMPTLAANIKVTYSGMGSVLASRSAGYLFGNLLGAILQNIVKKHSEGLLFFAFILPAIVVFATPFVTSLILMCILFFIQGLSKSFTDLGGNNLLLTMWGDNAAAPLNSVHFGYGTGAVFVNLLVRPFITQKVLSIHVTNNEEINSTLSLINPTKVNSNIIIPYSITAILCFLIAIGHIFFYVSEIRNRKQKLQVRQIDYSVVSTNLDNVNPSVNKENSSSYSPRTCGRGFFQYGLTLSIIFFIYAFFMGGNSQTFSKFFFSYLKFDKFNLSNEAASWGITLYWLSYSIGRLIFAIVSLFLSVNLCLSIIWFGALCLAIAWLIYVWIIDLTSTSLFILGAVTGLIFSPIFPLSFGFFNQRLNVIPMLLGLLLGGTALGAITFNKIAGVIIDRDPNHFPTILAVCILIAIIFYIVSHIVYFFHQRKNLLNARSSVINGPPLSSEYCNEEEQQIANYLKDQEDK
ncbi:unnamed protein product [Rotaria sordida]|uniref:Uncharacterized protein n=1 Tax=Rotaria sordida TaxID=392033 RepID=A0A814PR11_9BILA|nr:unnamed protein product [Rotaria sordida]CAF1320188.1 unnamed protein product [Rotaria sordida]